MCAISGRHNGDHELDQRYYGAGTGRFGSPDPGGISTALLKDPGSWNRYAYGGGDPVNRIDPTGTTWMCVGYNDDFSCYDDGSGDQTGGGGGQGSSKQPKRNDPEPTTPTLGGPATDKQKKIFANAARTAESKLRQAGSPCASDFGADALKTFDSASFTLGVSFASDPNGNPTAVPDPQIYASTNVGSQAVTINMVGSFFDISPTPGPDPGTVVPHDMGTGLNQTNFDAFVLLHELGHLTGVMGNDIGKNQKVADDFNKKILKDCFGVSWKP